MSNIKRANTSDKASGWSWDYEQMQSFQKVINRHTGEQISLEQIDGFLSLLSAKKCLIIEGEFTYNNF
jgi:hypothetical protein